MRIGLFSTQKCKKIPLLGAHYLSIPLILTTLIFSCKVTNKKLDSLINVIIDNQNAIEDYNKQIKNYQVSLEKIDKKIKSNQKELGEIAKEYEKNVSNINNYDSSEIYRYFAERYE